METKFNLAEIILGLTETYTALQCEEKELRSQHEATKQRMDETLTDICGLVRQLKEETLGTANPSPSQETE